MPTNIGIAPSFKLDNTILTNHLLTYMVKYISIIQNTSDKEKLINELIDLWERKVLDSVEIVKKNAVKSYSETSDEGEDIWNILMDASNMHIEDEIIDFGEKLKIMLKENLKLG